MNHIQPDPPEVEPEVQDTPSTVEIEADVWEDFFEQQDYIIQGN